MIENIFNEHRGRLCSKWQHYFDIYDRHLSRFINRPVNILEIGISGGGSLQIWKKYFGNNAKVSGIDIDPNCYFVEDQIQTFIGDQTNTTFLQSVINKIGIPDIIIDDGSHVQSHILKSFDYLYPLLSDRGVYIIEDCHTSYWPRFEGGLNSHLNVVDIMSRTVHDVNTKWYNLPRQPKLSNLDSIHFYDSVIVYEKKVQSTTRIMVNVDSNGVVVRETV